MRDSNNKNILANKAAVSITSTLYDRRALDCTDDKPLISSLNHLTFLASSSPKVREALANDGGLERLVDILYECKNPKNDQEKCTYSYKFMLAFQCLVYVATRGTEAIRKKVVEAGMIPVIATMLDNYLYVTGLGSGPEFGNRNRITVEQLLIKQIKQRQNKMLYCHHYSNDTTNTTTANNNNIHSSSTASTTNSTINSAINDSPTSPDINQMLRNIGRLVEETNTTLDLAEDLINQDMVLQEQNLNTNGAPSLVNSGTLSEDMDRSIVERVSTNTSASLLSNTTILPGTESLMEDSSEKLHGLGKENPNSHNCFSNVSTIHNDSNMETTKQKLMFLHFINRLNNLDDVSDANCELKKSYYELIESCCSKNQLLHNQDVSNILLENIENGGENLPFLSKINLSDENHDEDNINNHSCLYPISRDFENGILVPKENDIICSLQVLAFLSKHTSCRYSLADTYVVNGLTLRYCCNDDTSVTSTTPSLYQSKSDLDDMIVDDDPLFTSQNQYQVLLQQQQNSLRQRRQQSFQYNMPNRLGRRYTDLSNVADDDTSDDAIDIDEPLEYLPSSSILSPNSNHQQMLPGLMIQQQQQQQQQQSMNLMDRLPASQYDYLLNEFGKVHSYNSRLEKAVHLQKLNLKLARTLNKEHNLLRIKNKKIYELKRKDYEQRWNYEDFQDFEMCPENEYKSSYLDLDLYPTKRVNIFPLVEQFTVKQSFAKDILYWSQVIVRNCFRKDEMKGGRKQCAHFYCGKWEDKPRQFAKCRRCKKAKYCSKECQANAWNFHRYWCNPGSSSSSASTSSTAQMSTASNSATVEDELNHSHHNHHHHNHGHNQEIQNENDNRGTTNENNEEEISGRVSPSPLVPNHTSSTIVSNSSAASQSLFDGARMVLTADTQSIISGDSISTTSTNNIQVANASVPPLPNPATTVSSSLQPNINSIRNSLNTFATRVRVGDVQRNIEMVDESQQSNDDDMTM